MKVGVNSEQFQGCLMITLWKPSDKPSIEGQLEMNGFQQLLNQEIKVDNYISINET